MGISGAPAGRREVPLHLSFWLLQLARRSLSRRSRILLVAWRGRRFPLRLSRGRVCRRARDLKRDGHAAIDGQSVALAFGLRMQGRGIGRGARKMVNYLRLYTRRCGSLRFGRRGRRWRLFRASRRTRVPNRRQYDEGAHSKWKTGKNHADVVANGDENLVQIRPDGQLNRKFPIPSLQSAGPSSGTRLATNSSIAPHVASLDDAGTAR